MRLVRKMIKQGLSRLGYQLRRNDRIMDGRNAYVDMQSLIIRKNPVCFDVGANIGQTVFKFHKYLDAPVIHSFEPSDATFEQLVASTQGIANLTRNKFGLGANSESRIFYSNSDSTMSSFLPPGTECWGTVEVDKPIDVTSLDRYCEERAIESIDVLKTDTQGFDFEVIKGADEMLKSARIQLVFTEVIFNDQYEGQAEFDEMFRYLVDRGYRLVSFYEFFFRNKRAAFTDAMFVHPEFSATDTTSARRC